LNFGQTDALPYFGLYSRCREEWPVDRLRLQESIRRATKHQKPSIDWGMRLDWGIRPHLSWGERLTEFLSGWKFQLPMVVALIGYVLLFIWQGIRLRGASP
jgi:hypothetical protein